MSSAMRGPSVRTTYPTLHTRRLAEHLSGMLPQAATVKVRLQGPQTVWPHTGLTACDAAGARIRVSRTQALTAARWIIRAHPNAGWQRPHTFDLRTAQLDVQAAR